MSCTLTVPLALKSAGLALHVAGEQVGPAPSNRHDSSVPVPMPATNALATSTAARTMVPFFRLFGCT